MGLTSHSQAKQLSAGVVIFLDKDVAQISTKVMVFESRERVRTGLCSLPLEYPWIRFVVLIVV